MLDLRPIGVVRSPVRGRKQMPPWGVEAWVEVFPEFASGLLKIERHSHLWVLGWLIAGRDERHILQVTPRGVEDTSPAGLHGVFAVRSPARPNPIGLTVARILDINGAAIRLDRLDFLDGTPVLDLKPYFITRDLVFSANGRQIGRPRSREDLRDALVVQAVHFHGALTRDVALAVRLVEHYRLTFWELCDPVSWQIEAPLERREILDALIGMTRVTPGRGTLQFGDGAKVRFLPHAEYQLAADAPSDPAEALAADDGRLFTCFPLPCG